jgi:hypothetical protein
VDGGAEAGGARISIVLLISVTVTVPMAFTEEILSATEEYTGPVSGTISIATAAA